MALFRRFNVASASAALVSVLATPAAALELPRSGPTIYHEDSANNWGRRYHHHRDRVDAGDILAGVLILGGIAAVASAASKNNRSERYPAPPNPQDRQGYRSSSYNYPSDGRGLDSAVDMCVGQVERGQDRVGTVDGANRTGEGWTVSGALEGGQGFTCGIDNDGRLRTLDIGAWQGSLSTGPDRQYSDEVYRQARAAQDATEAGVTAPGTALPGEEDDRPIWQGDEGAAGG